MKNKYLLETKLYIQSCKDYTNGLCPVCHDEFNMIKQIDEPELDYNRNIFFIPMACDCGTMFIQILKPFDTYDRKDKIYKPKYKPVGYSHVCDCDDVDLTFDNCDCREKYKSSYTDDYDRYLILKPRYDALLNSDASN